MAVDALRRTSSNGTTPKTLFVFTWVLLCVIAGLIMGGVYFFETSRDKDLLCENTRDILRFQKTMITEDLTDMINDVQYVARHLESLEPWGRPIDDWKPEATADIALFAGTRQIYKHVRLIDAKGRELIRVDYHHNRPDPVEAGALQDKSDRYYVQLGAQLEPGEIYFSPMDLNQDQGVIETPYRPTIRFCMPIHTPEGEYFGLVVLNYDAERLKTLLSKLATSPDSQTMIANRAGYWLIHPDDTLEWGWQVPGRTGARLENQYPTLWAVLQTVNSGAVETKDGLFLYDTLTCKGIKASLVSDASFCRLSGKVDADDATGLSWSLIHYTPHDVLATAQMSLGKAMLFVLAIFCLLLLPLAWIITQFICRQQARHEQLKTRAFLDPVTGLANRNQFLDQLEIAFQMARRFGDPFAVMFIDLDGFKRINDTYGHDAGDALLAEVGQRLEHALRAIDLVARLGGDEFTILLPKVAENANAIVIAEKLTMALSQPLWFGSGSATITASLGIAFYNADASTSTELLTRADRAMYAAKLAGKNTYRFWAPDLQEHTSAYLETSVDDAPTK